MKPHSLRLAPGQKAVELRTSRGIWWFLKFLRRLFQQDTGIQWSNQEIEIAHEKTWGIQDDSSQFYFFIASFKLVKPFYSTRSKPIGNFSQLGALEEVINPTQIMVDSSNPNRWWWWWLHPYFQAESSSPFPSLHHLFHIFFWFS